MKSKDQLLSDALKAICLTVDYVGFQTLPAIQGWDWYDTGMDIVREIPADEWSLEFLARVDQFKRQQNDPSQPQEPKSLIKEIEACINKYSAESGSDTPDFILATYLTDTLEVFNKCVTAREAWYGRATMPSIVNLEEPQNTSVFPVGFADDRNEPAYPKP